jgi:hypothetical protein
MLTLAYFGIESSGLNLVVDLLILFVVVLYLALIYWTYADARRRILDPMLVGCGTAASLFFPFVGTIVYMILRPPEYLEDVHERELEVRAAEARLHELDPSLCPYCDYRIEKDFVRCPSCLRKLKERCVSCSRPLDQSWTICPYCETEVASATPSRRARRHRAAIAEGGAEPPELATGRPETARAKAARERQERDAARAAGEDLEKLEEEQSTRVAPVPASEPSGSRGGRSSDQRQARASGRARPST